MDFLNIECPETKIKKEELRIEFQKFYVFLCLLYGKPINVVNMLNALLNEEKLRTFLKERTHIDDDMNLIQQVLRAYPKLLKSKIVKRSIQNSLKNGCLKRK